MKITKDKDGTTIFDGKGEKGFLPAVVQSIAKLHQPYCLTQFYFDYKDYLPIPKQFDILADAIGEFRNEQA